MTGLPHIPERAFLKISKGNKGTYDYHVGVAVLLIKSVSLTVQPTKPPSQFINKYLKLAYSQSSRKKSKSRGA